MADLYLESAFLVAGSWEDLQDALCTRRFHHALGFLKLGLL